MDFFTVVYHHRGEIDHGPPFKYEGGEEHAVHGNDPDRWSFFEALGILRESGYGIGGRMWWGPTGDTLKEIKDDKDAAEVCDFSMKNKVEVDIYIEHNIVSTAYEVKMINSVEDIMDKLSQVNNSDDVGLEDIVVGESCEGVDVVEERAMKDHVPENVEVEVNDNVQVNDVAEPDHVQPNESVAEGDNVAEPDTMQHNESVAEGDNVPEPDTVQHMHPGVEHNFDNSSEGDYDEESETEVSDSDNDSVKEVHFEDSEEERDLGLNDGFDCFEIPQGVRITYADAPATEEDTIPATEETPAAPKGRKKKKTVDSANNRRQSARLRKLREPVIEGESNGDPAFNDEQFEEDYDTDELHSDAMESENEVRILSQMRAQGVNDGVGVGAAENGTQGSVNEGAGPSAGAAPNVSQGGTAPSNAQNLNQGAASASAAEDGNQGITHSVAEEPAPKRRKAKAYVVASASGVSAAAVVRTASQPMTRNQVRKQSAMTQPLQPMTRNQVRKQSAMTQPLPRGRGKKMYKGSSSKKPVADDFQDPCPNITVAQLLNGYMTMMDKVQNEARKNGIVIKGDNKEKGDGKKGGGND
ncbi:hypothetical protein RIF29_18081 [Crotalaria pallida]|uniref:PB1-like domain-containing protein n=1 Tax=Crotalaria pallida TaxID=3830 RepID=A0AAN9FIC0_CROPI